MNMFIDKKTRRRKSPLALYGFMLGLVFAAVFLGTYWLLIEPLAPLTIAGHAMLTTVIHAVVMALAGTAICLLGFLLPDKRLVPAGFIGLAVLLLMVAAAAMLLEGQARITMLYFAMMFGLAPVIVGNAAAWTLYLRFWHHGPQVDFDDLPGAKAALHPAAATGRPEAMSAEAAMFGPEGDDVKDPTAANDYQKEAMMFYGDEDVQAGQGHDE